MDGIRIIENNLDSITDPVLFLRKLKSLHINTQFLDSFRGRAKKDIDTQKRQDRKHNRRKREKVIICEDEYPICVKKMQEPGQSECFVFKDESMMDFQIDMNHLDHPQTVPDVHSPMIMRNMHTCQENSQEDKCTPSVRSSQHSYLPAQLLTTMTL